jgi:hypothetical protein
VYLIGILVFRFVRNHMSCSSRTSELWRCFTRRTRGVGVSAHTSQLQQYKSSNTTSDGSTLSRAKKSLRASCKHLGDGGGYAARRYSSHRSLRYPQSRDFLPPAPNIFPSRTLFDFHKPCTQLATRTLHSSSSQLGILSSADVRSKFRY